MADERDNAARNNAARNDFASHDMEQTPDAITDRIRRHHGYLILEAGAGTGKTHNLTERVIHQLIENGVRLERMLALTFTDFAAAEMRSRIYVAINRNIGTSKHLQATRQRFSHNYISTFHSFCNRILQYFPDEVTGISVPDAPRAFGRPDHERSVDGALELLTDYDEVLWMMEWRKRFYSKYKDHEVLQRQLTRLSVSDFEKFMNELSGVDEKALEELALLSPAEYPGWLGEVSNHWRAERDALLKELLDTFAAHPEWFASPDKIPRSVEALAAIKNKSGGFAKKAFNRNEIDEETLAEIGEQGDTLFGYHNALVMLDGYLSRPDLVRELADYPEQENFDPDHEAYWNMRDLAELGLRWGALMRYQRFEAGYFNYDDMIWLTHRLFTDHPAVTAQMRARFDQILVDEFQDTDRRQWEILEKLAFPDGVASRGGIEPDQDTGNREGKQLLIVGDVKQAIYGFRGGDVAMMRRAGGELTRRSEAPGAMPLMSVELPYSFRSNEAVIRFTNDLFRGILGPKSQAASYEAHHQPLRWPSAGQSRNAEAPGEVRILLADGGALEAELKKRQKGNPEGESNGNSKSDPNGGLKGDFIGGSKGDSKENSSDLVEAEVLASHPIHLEARRIAKFLCEIHDGRREAYDAIHQKMKKGKKAVGVLYKRRTHMYALEDALREAGLPFTVAKGKSYYMRREVRDAWLLLSFLLDAFDDVSLTGLLRSPMVSLSDSGLLTMRLVMDEDRSKYPNFWSVVSGHASWHGRLRDADRMALESAVPLLRKLREKVPFRRVSELLEEAFFTSGPYIGAFPADPQVRENLVKLLDVVRNLESTGRGTLFEVTGFLSNRIGEEAGDSEAEQADPAPIQLMTIHGSKGLEWPVVIVPDLARQSPPDSPLVRFDPELGVALKLEDEAGERQKSALYTLLEHRKKAADSEESKRVLYVALTRARDRLILTAAKTAGGGLDILQPGLEGLIAPAAIPFVPDLAQPVAPVAPNFPALPEQIMLYPARAGFAELPVTALSDYAICPLRFKFRHVDGHPGYTSGNSVPNFGMEIGKLTHKALELGITKVEILAAYAPYLPVSTVEEALTLAQHFHQVEVYAPHRAAATHSEQPISITVGGLTLNGVIDLVGEDYVLDFKTDQTINPEHHQFQLWAYSRATGKPQAHLAYLRHHCLYTFDATALSRLESQASFLISGLLKGDFMPTPSEASCGICSYIEVCDLCISHSNT